MKLSRTVFSVCCLLLSLPAWSSAQTATPTSRLTWNHNEADAAAAQSLIYEATFDSAPFVALASVLCVGTTCSAPFPALTPTTHTVQLRGVKVIGANRYEGPMSVPPFSFTFIALPAAPSDLRIATPPGL